MTHRIQSNDPVAVRKNLVGQVHETTLILRAFDLFPDLLTSTCWASDSGRTVFSCSCPQCRDLFNTIRTTGKLPAYLQNSVTA